MVKILFFISIVLCGCYAKRNYEVELTRFEPNPNSDPSWIDKGTLRITKKSRNQFVISGTWYVYKNIGNDGLLYLYLYNIGLANSLILIYSKSAKFCDYLEKEAILYPGLMKASNFPPRDQCPFPKGNYTLHDYTLDEDQLPPIIPTGKYTGKIVYKLDNKLAFGFNFDFTVSPA